MTHAHDSHDSALDAAWRTHVRGDPPAALDDAILAAAHRAAGSVPRAAPPRPPRWRAWAPLAVAATLGAIAFGVVQLAPREPDSTRAIVGDAPVAAMRAPAPVERQVQASQAPAAPLVTPPVPAPVVAAPVTAPRATSPAPAPRATSPVTAPHATLPAPPAVDVTGPAQPSTRTAPRDAAKPPIDALRKQRAASAADAGSGFVASPPPAPARAKADAAPAREADEAAAASQARRAEREGAVGERKDAPEPPKALAAATPSVPAAAPLAPAGELANRGVGAIAGARAAPDSRAAAPAARDRAANATTLESKVALTRAPADYVKDIRRLRDEGRDTDAARELNAFRAAYADADERLPEDLRVWARTVARP